MGAFTNSEDPDEMMHNVAFHHVKVKMIFTQKCNIFFNYNLTPLDIHNGPTVPSLLYHIKGKNPSQYNRLRELKRTITMAHLNNHSIGFG